MNLPPITKEFIKTTLPLLKRNDKLIMSSNSSIITRLSMYKNKKSEKTKAYHKVLNILYNDIYQAYKTVRQKACFKSHLHYIKKTMPSKKPDLFNNTRFFPAAIKQFINTHEKYQLNYTCTINGREIIIHFSLFYEEDLLHLDKYTEYVKNMYIWLSICGSYTSQKCASTSLDIYIYHTPFSKKIPNSMMTTLGCEQVNTAFTLHCAPAGEIVVYREEEWFKVFIHETFHSFGLDLGVNVPKTLLNSLRILFPIETDYSPAEAYAETWARIMNCAMCVFCALPNKKEFAMFIKNMDYCLQVERLFALYQCNKILKFMGLSYTDLFDLTDEKSYLRRSLYKEATHVFAYYILTAILMNDYEGFLLWCNTHNISLLEFTKNDFNYRELAVYIQENYNNANLIADMELLNTEYVKLGLVKMDSSIYGTLPSSHVLVETSRMSIIEII